VWRTVRNVQNFSCIQYNTIIIGAVCKHTTYLIIAKCYINVEFFNTYVGTYLSMHYNILLCKIQKYEFWLTVYLKQIK